MGRSANAGRRNEQQLYHQGDLILAGMVAWAIGHHIPDTGHHSQPEEWPRDLGESLRSPLCCVTAYVAEHGIKYVFVDTFSRSFNGDENDAKDVMLAFPSEEVLLFDKSSGRRIDTRMAT